MNEYEELKFKSLRKDVDELRARVLKLEAGQEPEDQLRKGWLMHRENARRKERGTS